MLNLDGFPISNAAHSSDVARWHIVGSHRRQSLAEHSFNVPMFATYLVAEIHPEISESDQLLMLYGGLWHDQAENKSGDIPTPAKRYVEKFFPKGESPFDVLEAAMCPPYARLKTRLEGTYLEVILKLADIMDAAHFIATSGSNGNEAVRIREERCRAFASYVEIGKAKWPELNWERAQSVLHELLHGQPESLSFDELLSQ